MHTAVENCQKSILITARDENEFMCCVNNLLSVSSLIILGLSRVDFARREEFKIAVTKYNSCIVELNFFK